MLACALFRKALRKMKVKRINLLLLALTPVFFAWSHLLLDHYISGDQVGYWKLYAALSGAGVADVMPLAQAIVSGAEPVSAYLLWLGAQLEIDKNVYMSLMNVLFLVGIILLFYKYRSPWYIYPLILTNFYVIVLMTGAERLKFAYILLVYAAVMLGRTGTFLALASPFAHLQSFIFLVSLAAGRATNILRDFAERFLVKRTVLIQACLLLTLAASALFYLWEAVEIKAIRYLKPDSDALEILNISLVLVIGLIASRNRLRLVFTLLPLIFVALLLGDSRVNMISVSAFIYLMLLENRVQHPLVLILLVYFSVKSISFVESIFLHGHGFG